MTTDKKSVQVTKTVGFYTANKQPHPTYLQVVAKTTPDRVPEPGSEEALVAPIPPESRTVKLGFGHLDLSNVKPIADESEAETHWYDCFKCGRK